MSGSSANTCREPRFDPDVWMDVVEAAMEAKAAGETSATELIEATDRSWSSKKGGSASVKPNPDSSGEEKAAPAPAPDSGAHAKEKGLADDLKNLSPEERKQAIKERVKARRAEKMKAKEL